MGRLLVTLSRTIPLTAWKCLVCGWFIGSGPMPGTLLEADCVICKAHRSFVKTSTVREINNHHDL